MAANISPAELKYMEEHAGESRVKSILACVVACGIIAYLAVGLRFVARRMVRGGIGADDYIIVAALILFTAFFIGLSLATNWGLGRHAIMVTNVEALSKSNLSDEVTYSFAIGFVKSSVLALYARIFPDERLRRAVFATACFVTAWALTSIFGSIFQCVPISSQWDYSIKGKCISYGNFVLAIGILNILTDFLILSLPVPVIWSLQMKKSKKLLTIFTLIAGSLACIVSIVRLAYAQSVGDSVDASWDDVGAGILSCVEICIGIVAGCIPTYRPLINRMLRLQGSNNDSKAGKITQTTDIQLRSLERTTFNDGPPKSVTRVTSGPIPFGRNRNDVDSDEERLYKRMPE